MKRAPVATILGSITALGAAALASMGAQVAEPEMNPHVSVAGLEAHETHASSSLLGQFRTNTSAWLWLRTDLYLHNGVQMRPLTDSELKNHEGSSSTDNEEHELHDDSKITTVVPSADHDFRGILGDVERATSTYKNMKHHKHNDPQTALPLFRLMTWTDPQFIPAWVVGANVIMWHRTPGSEDVAIKFLRDGLQENPGSVPIENELGSVILRRKHDPSHAIPHFEAAIKRFIRLGTHASEDEAQAAQESFRWLAIVHRDAGRPRQQAAVAKLGIKLFPDDRVLERLIPKN